MSYEVHTPVQHVTVTNFSEACVILIIGLNDHDPSGSTKIIYHVETSNEITVRKAVQWIATIMYDTETPHSGPIEFESGVRNFCINKL